MNDRVEAVALLELIAPGMVGDCIERTARKRHTCYTHHVIEARGARNVPAPDWAIATHTACSHVIEPGERYLEYMGESYAYESGSRYCAGCVSTGIPLGASDV
jgi:hypothetical protein